MKKIMDKNKEKAKEEKIIKNLKRCPSFEKCSQNLCPLDFGLHLRTGNNSDKCRWMKEPQKKKIKGREFISGGKVMPSGILNFVPESNLKQLNEVSKRQWRIIRKYEARNKNN